MTGTGFNWGITRSVTQSFANYAEPEDLLKAMRTFIKGLDIHYVVFDMTAFSTDAGWCGFVSYEP